MKFKADFGSGAVRAGLLAALVAAIFALCWGCRSRSRPEARAERDAAIARGAHVVVEASAAEFFEARVVEVSASDLRVQTTGGSETKRVNASDVYRIEPPASLKRGLAICRVAPSRWVGCRIDDILGDRVVAVDLQGKSRSLGAGEVIAPNAVTELNLKHAFRRSEVALRFQEEVARAGNPRAPRGWRPSPRERVLARDGDAWYSALIHEIEDERLHVRWRSDDRVTELGYADVVPEPPYPKAPARGSIVLVRPTALSAAWAPVRVSSTGAEIKVEDAAGAERAVSTSDVVPLAGR